MDTRIIQHNTPDYNEMITLRITQLLEPIGISADYIDREKEKNDILIGAFENGKIIGCCILTPKDTVVQLRQMAVQADYRGKGIGAAVVRFSEKIAKEKGYGILMMHARDPVIDFYKKCGYEVYGEPFLEVGMGHHKMQKQL